MLFPDNLSQLTELAETHQSQAMTAETRMRMQISLLQATEQQHKMFAGILKGLAKSWQEPDPGKYGDAYFFVNDDRERVAVEEFLPEGAVCKSKEEWNEYAATRKWYGESYKKVPLRYPIVTLEQVAKNTCPGCGESLPVIQHYTQTEDSPEGDAWLKEYLIVCLKCNKITRLDAKTSSHRMC